MAADRGLDPVEWLRQITEPGDLLLTGEAGLLSRAIQWGTRSHVSHTAIVRSADVVVEAYDFGLTPDEGDEGMFEHSFEELMERSDKLDCLIVRRPRGWTDERRARFDRALAYSLDHSPAFPTVGAGMACLLVALTRPEVRRITDPWTGRRRVWIDRLVDWLAHSVGDGQDRVHCSEVATRLYTWTGFELVFAEPTLGPVVLRMSGGDETEDGAARIHPERRRALAELPRRKRRAVRSQRPQVDKSAGSKVGTSTSWNATGQVFFATVFVAGTRGMIGTRPLDRRDPAPDMADLILPSDFERAEPFDTIGMLSRDGRAGGAWRETDHRPVGANGATAGSGCLSPSSRLRGLRSRRGR